jgi:hypothetical protein
MDGYTDPIRVDARDLRPGDRLITGATGRDYHTGVLDFEMPALRWVSQVFAITTDDGRPRIGVTFEDGTEGEVTGEYDETSHARFPAWAALKLDQPPVVNNTTYVDGYSQAGAEAAYELVCGHKAEYRTVHDGGIFRFDYVPDGWELRGSADEPFEAKADASDDDYDPGHIVEARPARPITPAERQANIADLIALAVEGLDGPPLVRWPIGVCFAKIRDAQEVTSKVAEDSGADDGEATESPAADTRPPIVVYAPFDYLNDQAWMDRVSDDLRSTHTDSNGLVFIPLGTQRSTGPPAPRRRSWWRK